jgi:hypothetical protein
MPKSVLLRETFSWGKLQGCQLKFKIQGLEAMLKDQVARLLARILANGIQLKANCQEL